MDNSRVPSESTYLLYGASFIGRDHARLGRNNQDAFACTAVDSPGGAPIFCAVVTDGCGQSRASEVGAALGARWLAEHLPRAWPERSPQEVATLVNRELALALDRTLGQLSPPQLEGRAGEQAKTARLVELGLFTWLAAVVGPDRWAVMGLGDGLFAVDGRLNVLDSGPLNAPDYVAYRLVPALHLDGAPHLEGRVFAEGSASDLHSLVVATDGAQGLEEHRGRAMPSGGALEGLAPLALHGAVARNPTLLERRLRVCGERMGVLHDDTTVAVIRRRSLSPVAPAPAPGRAP